MSTVKVVIVPGNGLGDVEGSSWYPWLRRTLKKGNIDCVLRNMPDPVKARESIWLPFMKNQLNCDENTIIVGHSSGAEAAMRFAERFPVLGLILVSACVTDLGDPQEAESGYYNRPWEWESIKKNTNWIVQFGSKDDPLIDFGEQKQVAEGTKSEFHQFDNKGHFNQQDTFPEIVKVIKDKLRN